ncbi:MAG: DUF1289 domain-containing protein [Caulobacteraceae bacterium]|uniref:DUF1289 domain-containing protein n=1 Tax=Brevundimonas staleyi TaxID=74326 RepID=A0ABW0FSN3_9CAUL|nr:DUF1289 domain-containing protein [Brevundimonas diminuta]MBX9706591.1 DUF1289 domain-containing protein [Caulobacteraceae bacterium]MDM8353487.1 DUF1289 domain-containing protein [Brevundimonas diminuta]
MAVKSPCIDVCRMDRKTGWCIGCLRSREEIRTWQAMTDHKRRQVLAERTRRVSKLPVRP